MFGTTSLDARELADELLHLLGDLRADRAGGGGQREGHVHGAAVDLDPVDQAELDEIESQLGVDDVGERLEDVVLVDHRQPSVGKSARCDLYEPCGSLYRPRIVCFDAQLAILRIEGDEDRTTSGRRRRPFSAALNATRDVIVDLSGLTFADPSLMIDLACLAQRLRARGVTLWLAHPQPNIRTLIETVGLHRLPAVRDRRRKARASPERAVVAFSGPPCRCCSSSSSSSSRSPSWRC